MTKSELGPACGARPLFLVRGGAIDGQQRQVLYLCKGLAKLGRSVVAALDSDGPMTDALLGLGVEARVFRMSSWRAPLRILRRRRDASRLYRWAEERNISLVHAHDVWKAEYARFIAKRLGIRYVVHVRGPISGRDIAKHCLREADAIVAIARSYVGDLIDGGVERARIRHIDDAVDLEAFDPAVPAAQQRLLDGSPNPPFVIGFVGRICRFKAVLEFLEIIARLPAEIRPRVRARIVGERADPEYGREVRALVEALGLGPQTEFLGRVDSDAMPQTLAGMDLLVTLSGGSVMFEAMAMARPVLSFCRHGRPFSHTRHDLTTWFADTADLETYAADLARLIADEPLRRRLGLAGRAYVAKNHSPEGVVERSIELYDELSWRRPCDDLAGAI